MGRGTCAPKGRIGTDLGPPPPPPPPPPPAPTAVVVPTLLFFLFSFLLPVDAVVPVVEARGDGEGLAPPGAVAMPPTPLPPAVGWT